MDRRSIDVGLLIHSFDSVEGLKNFKFRDDECSDDLVQIIKNDLSGVWSLAQGKSIVPPKFAWVNRITEELFAVGHIIRNTGERYCGIWSTLKDGLVVDLTKDQMVHLKDDLICKFWAQMQL